MPNIITLEMHLHSIGSHDSLMQPGMIIKSANKKKIDKLFVTDHNDIGLAKRMQERYPGRVFVGEEILTSKGELLAFFVSNKVPGGLEPLEAIRRLKDQGAFISVSHPFDRQRNGWQVGDLQEILPYVDALEVFNSRCLRNKMNMYAAEMAKEKQLLSTAGSDAHIYYEIGTSLVHLQDFHDAEGLRNALKSATLETKLSPAWVHFGSRWAEYAKKLGLTGKDAYLVDE